MSASRSRNVLAAIALVLGLACAVAIKPIAVPLTLSAWFAALARPWHRKLSARLRPSIAAGLMTMVLVLVVGVLVGMLYRFIVDGALSLTDQVTSAEGLRKALEALVTPGPRVEPNPENLKDLAEQHGAAAQTAAKWVGVLGFGTLLFIFFLGLGAFGLLTEGEKFHAWLRAHAPVTTESFDRLADAFTETGRGLLVSIGLTCLVQGTLCTGTFLALGVPRAPVLGFVSALFAVLPMVGTPLVWIPVALGFYLKGEMLKAGILVFTGAVVIGAIEFFVGPGFARLGRFKLPSGLILISMFGGALGLGPAGLIFGPLVFRLAMEATELSREAGE